MSAEKIANVDNQNVLQPVLETPKAVVKEFPGRVDINNLLARVREEKKRENKANLVFFGLFTSLIVVVGLILSF
jgi:hypothetical protein